MLSDWKAFLLSDGARIENNQVLDFGDPECEASAAMAESVMVDLSYLSIIRVTGADAAAFLNGQFTCDLSGLPEGHVRPGAWCNPKGQVIANFIIVRTGDVFYLLLPEDMKDGFINRLRMFVLRSQVTLEDCSDTLLCTGINTREGGRIDGTKISAMLSTQEQAIHYNGLVLFHVPVNWNRVIIAGTIDAVAAAWSNSKQLYNRTGSQYWRLFDVLDGLPWIGPGTTESILPQQLNLDQTGGLSFSKGCFPGQEVIARLHHRGKYKQRLLIAGLKSGSGLLPGEKIYSGDQDHHIGTVINTAEHPDEGTYALIVLDTDYGTVEQLRIENRSVTIDKITVPKYLE